MCLWSIADFLWENTHWMMCFRPKLRRASSLSKSNGRVIELRTFAKKPAAIVIDINILLSTKRVSYIVSFCMQTDSLLCSWYGSLLKRQWNSVCKRLWQPTYRPWNSRGRFFILVLKITRRAGFVFKIFFHVIFKSLLFLTQKYVTTRITFN